MKYLMSALLLSSLLFVACDTSSVDDNDCQNCRRVACTDDYRMITILVKDAMGNPIVLTSHEVTYAQTGEPVKQTSDMWAEDGYYEIASDGILNDVDCDGTEILFSYSTDGKNYQDATFLVGKDCCHIQYLDQKEHEIVID